MNLKSPKKNTFWASVIVAVVGVIVYGLHLVTFYLFKLNIPHLELIAFLLELVAYILLFLGLTQKSL